MKHIVIAIIVVIVVLSLGIFEQYLIRDIFDEVSLRAVNIRTLLINKDYDKALSEAEGLIEYWTKKLDYMELIFSHNEFRDIICEISELKGAISTAQYEDAIVSTHIIEKDAMNHQDILSFRLKNVM